MSVKAIIISHFERVAKEHNKALSPLVDTLLLIDSGLDSLCFAIVVARLEDELGVDPFSTGEDIRFPVTVSDFVSAYEGAVAVFTRMHPSAHDS